MNTCGLPRGNGCGSCDTCRYQDGTYASGPVERWWDGVRLLAGWTVVSFLIGLGLTLVIPWTVWECAAAVFVLPMVVFILFIGLGPYY